MDLVSLPHHVIQRVFDFMDPLDVYRCRGVSRTFYHEAMERLTHTPIDACQSVARLIKMDENSLFGIASAQREITEREVIMRNRSMNQENTSANNRFEPLTWWYFKRETNFQHSPKSDMDRALKEFLIESKNFIPSLTFIRVDPSVRNLLYGFPFKYPTIGVDSVSRKIRSDDEILRAPLHSLLNIPQDIRLSDHLRSYIEPKIEALHINRFASDHKIILTDWSNRESAKPNLNDPEYPVKAFIYFLERSGEMYGEVFGFSREQEFDVLECEIEEDEAMYRNPLDGGQGWACTAYSVAFAGKEIKSAMHSFSTTNDSGFFQSAIEDDLEFTQELIKFKNSLDFPTNDGRVLGFLQVSPPQWRDNPFGRCANRLEENFGSVKFVNLQNRIPGEDDEKYLIMLLIHI